MDASDELTQAVLTAYHEGTPLRIEGSGSKAQSGLPVQGEALSVIHHRGITTFEPTELVLSARAGTPLSDLEAALEEAGQMLPFEPPHLGEGDTLGGVLACGLSGPRRPFAGAARDLVLGVRIINGRGENLHFGGEVMKNVAGYDIARLMVGAHGTLGVLLEASMKVLPRPAVNITRVLELDETQALEKMAALGGEPFPLSGLAYHDGRVYIRLSGSAAGVAAASREIGGETLVHDAAWWRQLADQKNPFFTGDAPLWRLALPPAVPPLPVAGHWLHDWGGSQRWLRSRAEGSVIRAAAAAAGGHAACIKGPVHERALGPHATLLALHKKLKTAFDPKRILNPGRMHPDL